MTDTTVEQQYKLVIDDNHVAKAVYGRQDEYLKLIEDRFPVHIVTRGNEITISGRPADIQPVVECLEFLIKQVKETGSVSLQMVRYALRLSGEGNGNYLGNVTGEVIVETARGKKIRPKTLGQQEYYRLMKDNGIVFAIGPAGTGKTYMAMAMAVAELRRGAVSRIILTRPAVEAGESLGFLPGDLQEKVDPYLRPLYDALYEILGSDTFDKYMARGMIEVAPLAYMRGRTLDNSFVILDEAQNTTPQQMKMFLTRLGFGSQAVVTGDITQVDLPRSRVERSGLEQAALILKDIDGIGFVHLTERDVIRHPLVQQIIRAYEAFEARKSQSIQDE